MKKIDLKSFLIGILLMSLIFIIMASNKENYPPSKIGKYQVAAAATDRTPKYIIIDTENGSIVKTGYISKE